MQYVGSPRPASASPLFSRQSKRLLPARSSQSGPRLLGHRPSVRWNKPAANFPRVATAHAARLVRDARFKQARLIEALSMGTMIRNRL
jgi:hypothetical protein